MADEKELEGQSASSTAAAEPAASEEKVAEVKVAEVKVAEVKKDEAVETLVGVATAPNPAADPEIPPPPMTKTDSSPSAASSSAPATAKADPAKPPVQPRERRSRWESAFAALRYLSGIGKDTGIKLRDTDRATSYALLVISILTMLSLFVPQLALYRFNMLAVCDVLAGVTIIFYLANRFGIITTLPPRAALLTWQLILGAWFIGIFFTINVVLIGFLGQHLPNVPDTQPVHVVK